MPRLAIDFEHYQEQRLNCDSSRFLDIKYNDLVRDPIETVRLIYNNFNIELSTEAEKRMRTFLANEKRSKSSHQYNPQDFGLSPQLIRHRFQSYIDTFNIPEEN